MIVDVEFAEKEFYRFLELMEIEADEEKLTDEQLNAFVENRQIFVNEIAKGNLIINDNGNPIYSVPKTDKKITFYTGTGQVLIEMGRKSDEASKMYAAMASLSREHPSVFVNMNLKNVKVCMAIAAFFLV